MKGNPYAPVQAILPSDTPYEGGLVMIGDSLRLVLKLHQLSTDRSRHGMIRLSVGFCDLVDSLDYPIELVSEGIGAHRQHYLVIPWAANITVPDKKRKTPFDALIRTLAPKPAPMGSKRLIADEISEGRRSLSDRAATISSLLKQAQINATPLSAEEICLLVLRSYGLRNPELGPAAARALIGPDTWPEAFSGILLRTVPLSAEKETLISGSLFNRTLYWGTFPPHVQDGWLQRIVERHAFPTRVALYVNPLPAKQWIKKARLQIAHDHAEVVSDRQRGFLPRPLIEHRLQQMTELLDAVEQDVTKPYQVSVFITVEAESESLLDARVDQLIESITSGSLKVAQFRQREAFETALPLLYHRMLDHSSVRFVHTQGVSTMIPLYPATDNPPDPPTLLPVGF